MSIAQCRVRRIVTGHDDNGLAVFRSIDSLVPEKIPSGDAAFATIWSTGEVPVDFTMKPMADCAMSV